MRLVFLFCFSLFLFGCQSIAIGAPAAATPEQAVERANPPAVGEQRVYATTFTANGALVLFRTLNAKPDEFELGHAYVTRTPLGWQANEMGGMGGPAARATPFSLSIGSPITPPNRNIVSAMIHDARITVMRVTFANGETLTSPVNNNMVGVVAEAKTAACRIEFTDAQNQSLYAYQVATNPEGMTFTDTEVEWAKKECK